MSKCSKICNIVMLVLLLGSIRGYFPFVPVNSNIFSLPTIHMNIQ